MFHDDHAYALSPWSVLESADFATEFARVQTWPRLRGDTSVARGARKEIERFIVWLVLRELTLETFEPSHVGDYRRFLADPQPSSFWVARPQPRYTGTEPNRAWRPFAGGLSESSVKQACATLHGLYEHLGATSGKENPWQEKRRRGKARAARPASVLAEDLDVLLEVLRHHAQLVVTVGNAPPDSAALRFVRDYWLLVFALSTAATPAQLVGTRMSSFYRNEFGWWLRLAEDATEARHVALGPHLLQSLRAYRQAMGMPPLPSAAETEIPVVGDAHGGAHPLSSSTLYKAVRGLLSCSIVHPPPNASSICVLHAGSPSWLRKCALRLQEDALKAVRLSREHQEFISASSQKLAVAVAWELRLPGVSPQSLFSRRIAKS